MKFGDELRRLCRAGTNSTAVNGIEFCVDSGRISTREKERSHNKPFKSNNYPYDNGCREQLINEGSVQGSDLEYR